MAIYTILIHCSLLFIWVAKYCSGQTDFYIQPFRTIHFVTANETSETSIPYFNKSVYTKTSLYFKIETGCECNITLFQEGDNLSLKIVMEKNTINNRPIRNGSRIHVSCQLFRNVNISIRWESDVFTLGTVQMVNETFLRKTVISSRLGNAANQAIFTSAGKTKWTFYEADTVSSMVTNIFKNAALLCPILPHYKELPLNVNFLNKSLQCSGKIGIETECNTQGIIIEYKCSAEREKCTDLNDTLWIAACHATTGRDCKSCKIRNYKRYIPKICQNDITIVNDDSLLAADNCFEASKYLILWHEIKDVFPLDQYSSQRPPPTTGVFTTLIDSASYTTVEEKSSSTRLLQTTRSLTPIHSEHVTVTSTVEEKSSSTKLLQTTRSLTPIHSEHVTVTSTADSMLIDDKKPGQISDNQKVIGLTIGASISAAIIVILLICLFVVLRRRSIERKSAKKHQTIQNSEDGNDYTGRQHIALPTQEDLSEYNELAMRRDSHQYGDLTSVGTKPNDTTYDYIDHHKHKQETDICKIDQINSIQDPYDELIRDYSVLDPNEKILNTVENMSNTGRVGDTYAVLGLDESTTLCSGIDNSDRLDKPCFESNIKHTKELICSQTKDEAYAVLDPNITGFDRTENVAKNESAETYTVLDPSITGFNRSDLTNGPGDMTMDHVNKKSLIQPYKEDGNDYEFAKPIDDNLSSKSYLPSYRDRANSGESYGTYQTGNTRPLQDIHQQNSEENVYNRTVDDVYDSAAHQRLPTSRDDTYDHFSGQKINDCGKP